MTMAYGERRSSTTVNIAAYVQVSRNLRRGRLVALCLAETLIMIALVMGFSVGIRVSLLAMVLALWLAYIIKVESTSSEPRVVQVGVTVGPAGVVVEMPGARLWSGRYVDQRYSCASSALDGAGLDETGTFRLRARTLVSEALEGGVVLDRREHDYGEVSFRPVSDEGARALIAAFEG